MECKITSTSLRLAGARPGNVAVGSARTVADRRSAEFIPLQAVRQSTHPNFSRTFSSRVFKRNKFRAPVAGSGCARLTAAFTLLEVMLASGGGLLALIV